MFFGFCFELFDLVIQWQDLYQWNCKFSNKLNSHEVFNKIVSLTAKERKTDNTEGLQQKTESNVFF